MGLEQELSLDNGCFRQQKIMHEFMHALGFWHEHSRPDRDQYITIHTDNVKEASKSNFNRHCDSETYNVPYDVESIMHYRFEDFSKNGNPTIESKVNDFDFLIAFKKPLF